MPAKEPKQSGGQFVQVHLIFGIDAAVGGWIIPGHRRQYRKVAFGFDPLALWLSDGYIDQQ